MFLSPTGYLHHYLRKEVSELYWSASIRKLATSMLAIFATIYLYNLGFSIRQIALWHAVIYLSYAIFIFVSAKVINYIGYELCMAISIPFGIVIYFFYLMMPGHFYLFYPLFPILSQMVKLDNLSYVRNSNFMSSFTTGFFVIAVKKDSNK